MTLVKAWQYLIFSNLLIALAAASQSSLSYYILHIPMNGYVVILEGAATLLLYNFSMWLSMPKKYNHSPYLRTKWFFAHQFSFWTFSIIAIILLIYALLHLHLYTFMLLTIIGLLSLGYALPFLKHQGKKISLRQLMGAKVFLIALVWSLSVVGMPVMEYAYTSTIGLLNWTKIFAWGLLQYIFVLAITLPFDIRDMKQDRYYNLQTIPVIIGKRNTQILGYCLITLHIILVFYFFSNDSLKKWSLLWTDLITLFLFYAFIFKQKANYERVYLLDLVLIIQFIVLFAFYYL